jgi:hypothetical protein
MNNKTPLQAGRKEGSDTTVKYLAKIFSVGEDDLLYMNILPLVSAHSPLLKQHSQQLGV